MPRRCFDMKESIRKEMIAKRDSIAPEQRAAASEKISSMLAARPAFLQSKVIAFYLSKGSEVDLRTAIEIALAQGKTVLVPVTNDHIEMVVFKGFENLRQGRFGILEPNEKIAGPEPDVVVVPGVAFGLCMHRIGYGKGYYDRYLKGRKAYRIGVCYDAQLIERLPAHPFDEQMDEIITEKRVVVKKI